MASHLDLEEQEQLDQLKAFWDAYGNLITAVLVVVVGGYLAWLGWNAYQRDQGAKAGAMYDELDRAAQAGDATRAGSIFGDMKERYPRAAFTAQGGMLAAKTAFDKGQLDAARGDLAWVADSGAEGAYRAAARLRLAGLLLDAKKYDEALKQLDAIDEPEFAALAADRRGDVLAASGKLDEAKAAYQKAFAAMDAKVDYRRLVEAKLNVLGAAPGASEVSGAGASK
jgi:predicted negative regulator of RcsB-dependent stress response